MLDEIQARAASRRSASSSAKVKDKNSRRAADGLRPPRLQELRPARQADARRPATRCSASSACGDDPLFKLAMALEKIALEDEYFVQRKLYPNVDFYSGIVQKAIGIPVQLFTAIFALARTVGWIAQWNEMVADPGVQDRPAAPALHRRDAA